MIQISNLPLPVGGDLDQLRKRAARALGMTEAASSAPIPAAPPARAVRLLIVREPLPVPMGRTLTTGWKRKVARACPAVVAGVAVG